jgi:predicted metal-dependent RNase
MAYSEKNLKASLIAIYATAPTNDLTTLFSRHIGTNRRTAGDTPLYDGDDIADEVKIYLQALPDAP